MIILQNRFDNNKKRLAYRTSGLKVMMILAYLGFFRGSGTAFQKTFENFFDFCKADKISLAALPNQ